MEIVVHDNTLKTVAVINNDIPMLPSFFNDNWHRYKDQGAETFIFTVNKFINGQLQDYCRFLNEQAYISFTYDGIDYLFGVDNVQESDYQITLTCSSLNLELRNEQANVLVNTSSHNIQWYFDQMELISNAQITIGTNEVSSLTRTINYDGQESKLARLISVIGNFDAEFEFITHLNDDGTLDSIILNIYRANDGVNIQGVGTNRNDVSLNFGKNISGITRTGDTTNLFNATKITGSDDLNWNSSEFSYVNSDGVEEFYKRKNDDTAFAPLSLNLFKSQIKTNNGDKWIRKDFQTEYTNVNDMWGYCVSQFKQFAYPTVTYEVLANSSLVLESVGNDRPLSIGDTINIQDDNFMDSDGNVGLLLSARVSEMEISFSNPTLNKITFSNFKKQQSEASTDIQAIVNQLVDAATPYIGSISTTNGVQFKNGTGSTTLSAHIFKGSATAETIADSYEWSKDGTVVANVQEITVDASGVADKAVYSFKATVAGKVVANQSVTITNVDDGTNGRSVTNVSQKWRLTTTTATPTQAWSDAGWLTTQPTTTATNKYLWSITRTTFNLAPLTQDVIEQKAVYGDKGDKGDTGNDGRAGKDGVGINSTTITYAISSSGTVTPTAGWNSQVPTLVKGQYLWTKTVWNYSDGTSESGYTVSYIAKDGNNGNDGIAGKDGVGIRRTTITYASGTSGTEAPTSGWNSQVQNVPAGQYLWTKTVWDYTDNTNETGYSVSKIGERGPKGNDGERGLQGEKGEQGIPGPKGADGKTQYTHIAYANSADGVTDFSTSDSNRAYIGMYVDFNVNDSTTPSDYSWTLVKGADGTQGTPGKPGADGKTPYFHTAWSYSADGTDGFTTVYPNLNLGDNTKTFVGTEDEASNLRGSIRIDPATQKTQDGDFYYLTAKAPRDNYDWFRFFLIPNTATPNMTKVAVKPNTKYTFSVYLKGTGQHTVYAYKDWTAPNTPWEFQVNLTNDWKLYTFTVTSKNIIPNSDVQFFIRSNKGTEISLKNPKVEQGSTATPYMQSASEVTTADWPSYIGQYTDFTQADSTNPSAYTWSLIRGDDGKPGLDGHDGRAGKDGVGIKTTVITYAISTSGTTAPTTGWTSSVPSLVKGQYLWTKTVWTYTDNSSETGYSVSYISKDGNNGHDGIAGKDGVGLINTTLRYAKSKDGVNKPEGRIVASFTDKFIPARSIIDNLIMTGKQVHLEQGKTYILSAETNGVFTNVHNVEQSNNNATIWIVNPSFSTWDIISDTNTAIGTKYTHNRPTGDYEIRINSYVIDNSIWVKNIVFEDGTWTPNIPAANPGEYLWTRTTWFYSDNTNETGFSVAKMGEQGPKGDRGDDGLPGKDGVGIKTTVITYAISTSGTTAPTTGWTSSVPSLVKGQYLWTKTVWTYTDNSSETGYSVSYISKDGNNGHDGIAGKDGTGIKTTTITYAGSTSGTTAPTSGWTSAVPMVEAGSYLWTKTVWAYTDNTSETGYSVAKMGNNGAPGPQGPPGSNGDPGKTVSNTEPTTRFKGLTWKYSGTADLTASDGTVIKPNTEYYYNSTHWVINYFSVNNFAAESITSDKIDGKNLTITDGEFISKTTNGLVTTSTEIKDNHIAISKTDGTVNTRNDIALDSEQGLAQKFTNINTGFYRTAGINYQGPFTSDSDGNYAQLTPQGTKLSTDVPWTKLSLMNNFTGNIEYAIINGTVYISASGVGVPAMTAGQWKQAAQLPTGSSAIPIRANRIAAGDSGDGLSWALLSNQAGGIFIRCSANKAPTANLFNATLPYPIG